MFHLYRQGLLLVEETGVVHITHWLGASHWHTLSHTLMLYASTCQSGTYHRRFISIDFEHTFFIECPGYCWRFSVLIPQGCPSWRIWAALSKGKWDCQIIIRKGWSWTMNIVGKVFGEWHTPCTLNTLFISKESMHLVAAVFLVPVQFAIFFPLRICVFMIFLFIT